MNPLFGMRDAKSIQSVRMQRANRRRTAMGLGTVDSFVKPDAKAGDVIEVSFGAACDTSRIGA